MIGKEKLLKEMIADNWAYVKECLKELNDEERLELFSDYCKHCGTFTGEGTCHCWNDE